MPRDELKNLARIGQLKPEPPARAELVEPDRTELVTLRVKRSVFAYFRAPGKGYQSRMNRVLESYVRAQGK